MNVIFPPNQSLIKLLFKPCMSNGNSLFKMNSQTVTSLFKTGRKSQQIQTTDEDDNDDVSMIKVIIITIKKQA